MSDISEMDEYEEDEDEVIEGEDSEESESVKFNSRRSTSAPLDISKLGSLASAKTDDDDEFDF
jgi:hypothetical protein